MSNFRVLDVHKDAKILQTGVNRFIGDQKDSVTCPQKGLEEMYSALAQTLQERSWAWAVNHRLSPINKLTDASCVTQVKESNFGVIFAPGMRVKKKHTQGQRLRS